MPRILRYEDSNPVLTGYMRGMTPETVLVDYTPITSGRGANFFVVEIEAFLPGSGTGAAWVVGPWAQYPYGAHTITPPIAQTTLTIRASDSGYRTRATDTIGVQAYPPKIVSSIELSRTMTVDPDQTTVGWSGGILKLTNDDGAFDEMFRNYSVVGRRIAVYWGQKVFDDARGYFVSPAYADLVVLLVGVAARWDLDADTLNVKLRDASFWTEKPYQPNAYQGAGAYDGNTEITGQNIPRVRGGSATTPVRNITPTLISKTRNIYQFNDGPGGVVKVYEGGRAVFTADGDVGNLFATTAPLAGHYHTDNARGAFELGSTPVHAITVDVFGTFPFAGAQTNWADIARYIATEDMSVPAANMDLDSFTTAATSYPYVAGMAFGSTDSADGATAISRSLASVGAKLVDDKAGRLRVVVLRDIVVNDTITEAELAVLQAKVAQLTIEMTEIENRITALENHGVFTPLNSILPTALALAAVVASLGATTVALGISTANAVSVVPVALPSSLDPTPDRIRLAWQHNWTVQTSDLNAAADPAQKQFAAVADTIAAYFNPSVATRIATPGDPEPFGGGLLVEADAKTVVAEVGAHLTGDRRAYAAAVPLEIGAGIELGDVVELKFPVGGLRSGKLGQVYFWGFNSSEPTVTIQVLT